MMAAASIIDLGADDRLELLGVTMNAPSSCVRWRMIISSTSLSDSRLNCANGPGRETEAPILACLLATRAASFERLLAVAAAACCVGVRGSFRRLLAQHRALRVLFAVALHLRSYPSAGGSSSGPGPYVLTPVNWARMAARALPGVPTELLRSRAAAR